MSPRERDILQGLVELQQLRRQVDPTKGRRRRVCSLQRPQGPWRHVMAIPSPTIERSLNLSHSSPLPPPDRARLGPLLEALRRAADQAGPKGVDPELGPATLLEARACGKAEGLHQALLLAHQFAYRYGPFSDD